MSLPHEDVVIDLLPLYFAGDASPASCALVDAYFAAHPDFAQAMHAGQGAPVLPATTVDPHGGTVALKRIRTLLRWRAALIASAVFCSLTPLSFIFEHDRLGFFMLRDAPMAALIWIGIAALAWMAVFTLGRRSNI